MKRGTISVIIPVYNVEDYIDQCMETICGQTYTDLEILLINDGSCDGSLDKCLEWQEKDSRVKVIDKENGGVSSARNLGLDMAGGEFIAFVDPDDWVDLAYFEKLLNALVENDADLAECDLYRYDNRTGKKIYRSCYGQMGAAYSLKEHMIYGPTACYKALSRKSLWTDHDIRMPSCSFESPAVYSLVLALSRKTVNVREALYYYRRFRDNSLIETGYAENGKTNNTLGIEAMTFLLSEYKRCGIYGRFEDTVERIVKYRLSDILAMQYHRKRPEDYAELTDNYHRFLEETFPQGRNERYLTVGGYNLNRILAHMRWLHDPGLRFNFSSLITVLNESPLPIEAVSRNRYRQIMLQKELDGELLRRCVSGTANYVFADLIEERFDILDLDGSYITLSDAFEGASFTYKGRLMTPEELKCAGRVIKRSDEECSELWKKAFGRFIGAVGTSGEVRKVCMVENYLAGEVGDLEARKPFPGSEEIAETNKILKSCYDHIRTAYPQILIISPAEDDLYFTDINYEYGAISSHLNELENRHIAALIESKI